jgi:hypothetical protein
LSINLSRFSTGDAIYAGKHSENADIIEAAINELQAQVAALQPGLPGGDNTQIQFNDAGALGGDAELTWNKTTNTLTVGDTTVGYVQGAPNPAGAGGALIAKGCDSVGTGNAAGDGYVTGGTPTDGDGGKAILLGSAGAGNDRGGGDAQVQAGSSTGTGSGGRVLIDGGPSTGTGEGGEVKIKGGRAFGTEGDGGDVSITGGIPAGSSEAGKINLNSNVVFPGSLRFLGFVSSEAAPTTAELPADKDLAIHNDTVLGTIRLAFNAGGAIKSVVLA